MFNVKRNAPLAPSAKTVRRRATAAKGPSTATKPPEVAAAESVNRDSAERLVKSRVPRDRLEETATKLVDVLEETKFAGKMEDA